MQTSTVFLVLVALCLVSFLAGRQRSRIVAMSSGGLTALHSLPKHYGYLTFAWAALPAMLVLIVFTAMESRILSQQVIAALPADIRAVSQEEVGLYYNQILGYAQGGTLAAPVFRRFAEKAMAGMPKRPFVAPKGIRMVRVDRKSGKRVFGGWPGRGPQIGGDLGRVQA